MPQPRPPDAPPPSSPHDEPGRAGAPPRAERRAGDRRRYWAKVEGQKQDILNVRADATRRSGMLHRGLARMARALGHPAFFAAELAFHVGWIALNLGAAPDVEPWDPYPFGMLGGLASVQALFIGLLILMYEVRDARVGELREETDLQVSLHAERETTKLIQLMLDVHRALGIRSAEGDADLPEMARPLDPASLRDDTERRLRDADAGT